jgi:hypothetical protein
VLRRETTIGVLAATTLVVGGCGGSSKFANKVSPPLPVNLTVYINDARVSVSPARVGAGPVIFQVTNQASKAESVAIMRAGGAGGQPLATTGPINPQATAQVTVDLTAQGDYTVTTATGDGGDATDASLSNPSQITPARIHVGAVRAKSHGVLMTP